MTSSTRFNWEIAYAWNMRFVVVMALRYHDHPFAIVGHDPIRAYWQLLHDDDPVEMEVALTPEGIAKLERLFTRWLGDKPHRLGQRQVETACLEKSREAL